MTVGKNDTWITPPEIWTKLGRFDTDPACPEFIRCPIAGCCYTPSDDGLKQKWIGRVWLNPPFNRYERPKWMRRMADHGNGIMLIPAATETKAFKESVWDRATAVCFVEGRPHFHHEDNTRAKFNCGTAIVLVAYGEENAYRLRESGLGTTLYLSGRTAVSSALKFATDCLEWGCTDSGNRIAIERARGLLAPTQPGGDR